MSVFIVNGVATGPFSSITVESGYLDCDGVHYPFSVIGAYTLSEDDSMIAPLTPSVIIPDIDKLQARLYLISVNKWALIQPAIDLIADDMMKQKAQAYFEDAKIWNRYDDFVVMLAPALSYDAAGLDAAFIAAAKI